jgi:FMN-dependent NADH-azoreductase
MTFQTVQFLTLSVYFNMADTIVFFIGMYNDHFPTFLKSMHIKQVAFANIIS